MIDKCSCLNEGYCERHKMQKNIEQFKICQRDDDVGERFRRAWDRQTGYVSKNMTDADKKQPQPPRTGGCGCGAKHPEVKNDPPPTTAILIGADGQPTGQEVEVIANQIAVPVESAPSYQLVPPAKVNSGIVIKPVENAQKLILKNKLSPGDILVMSVAIYSLHKQFPKQYVTDVDCPVPAIYDHNPDVTKFDPKDQTARAIDMHYPLINNSNQLPVHFVQGYVDYLAGQLKIPLTIQSNRPHIYLSEDEKQWLSQVQEITGKPMKYWVINAGTKQDYTAKRWGRDQYQKLVHLLKGKVNFVQIGEKSHLHKPLDGVIDLLGKTDTRQLMRLCWHAQGGVGPITFIQHIFAAFEKPYVALLGGREPLSWEHYPTQTTMSTIGQLSCCLNGGCWKSRVVPLGDKDEKDTVLCEFPTYGYEEPIPRCMAMIKPEEVARAVEKYYEGGRLAY